MEGKNERYVTRNIDDVRAHLLKLLVDMSERNCMPQEVLGIEENVIRIKIPEQQPPKPLEASKSNSLYDVKKELIVRKSRTVGDGKMFETFIKKLIEDNPAIRFLVIEKPIREYLLRVLKERIVTLTKAFKTEPIIWITHRWDAQSYESPCEQSPPRLFFPKKLKNYNSTTRHEIIK